MPVALMALRVCSFGGGILQLQLQLTNADERGLDGWTRILQRRCFGELPLQLHLPNADGRMDADGQWPSSESLRAHPGS